MHGDDTADAMYRMPWCGVQPSRVLTLIQHASVAYTISCVWLCVQDYEIDFISLSYTRSVDDVIEARAFLDAVGLQNTKVIAKLESRQSLLNFKGILNEADGIAISRCLPFQFDLVLV